MVVAMTIQMPAPAATRQIERFDPQGHQMGPLGTIAAQLSLVAGLLWAMGALGGLLLPPTIGILTIAPAFGALLLAPRTILMQFPVSLSILGIFAIAVGSIAWTIDPVASSATLKGSIPATSAVALAGGMLGLRDTADGLIWAIRVALLVTFIACWPLSPKPEPTSGMAERSTIPAGTASSTTRTTWHRSWCVLAAYVWGLSQGTKVAAAP